MKKILKIVFGFLGVVYLAVAVFAIVCLLSKNRFGYPQFGEKTLFVVEDDNTALNYRKGDLVVLRKPKNEDIHEKDAIFFYDTDFNKNVIIIGKVTKAEVINENETTFYVTGKSFSSEYVVGKVDGSKTYHTVGSILNIILSKWGFFLIIIVAFFISFMVVLFEIYAEVKYGNRKKNN